MNSSVREILEHWRKMGGLPKKCQRTPEEIEERRQILTQAYEQAGLISSSKSAD